MRIWPFSEPVADSQAGQKASVSATGSRCSLETSYVHLGGGGGESGRKPQYVTPNVLFDMNISELKAVMKPAKAGSVLSLSLLSLSFSLSVPSLKTSIHSLRKEHLSAQFQPEGIAQQVSLWKPTATSFCPVSSLSPVFSGEDSTS